MTVIADGHYHLVGLCLQGRHCASEYRQGFAIEHVGEGSMNGLVVAREIVEVKEIVKTRMILTGSENWNTLASDGVVVRPNVIVTETERKRVNESQSTVSSDEVMDCETWAVVGHPETPDESRIDRENRVVVAEVVSASENRNNDDVVVLEQEGTSIVLDYHHSLDHHGTALA